MEAQQYLHRPRADGTRDVTVLKKNGDMVTVSIPRALSDDMKKQLTGRAADSTLDNMLLSGWVGIRRYGHGLGDWLKRHRAVYLRFVPTMDESARSTLPRSLSTDELQQLVDEAHRCVPDLGIDPVASHPSALRLDRGVIEHEVLMALESDEPFPLLRSLGLEDLLLSNHAQYSSKIPAIPPAPSRRRRRDSGDDDDSHRPSRRRASRLPAVAAHPSRQPKRKARSPALDPAFPQISSPLRKVPSPERDKGRDVAAAAAAARGRSPPLSPQPMDEDPPPPAAAAAAAASVVMPKAAPARPSAAAPAARRLPSPPPWAVHPQPAALASPLRRSNPPPPAAASPERSRFSRPLQSPASPPPPPPPLLSPPPSPPPAAAAAAARQPRPAGPSVHSVDLFYDSDEGEAEEDESDRDEESHVGGDYPVCVRPFRPAAVA
ncbi:unnamed protein product [Vitrella brassicaformis CCMP3155]|uniref:Uncharacterized protein n=1 Tax=Vitrella brassicaformis (strain CCMP3155) TaxID=1169540 RepID=A0A0G4H1Y7_VITBC|nr:unnamed protein product [Vitrella brassicaformis CCMP3155]|eukprot:CEM37519.1 unnamed protein product [Vitrella brassicaformis CCMP3155]